MAGGTSSTKRFLPRPSAGWAVVVTAAVTAATAGIGLAPGSASAAPAGTTAASAGGAPCTRAVTFTTEIQWGGPDAPWHPDSDLTLLVSNRHDVIAGDAIPVGTQITWSGPAGNASIVFFGEGDFSGSAQFPNEGPVAYRGIRKQDSPYAGASNCDEATTYASQIQWGGLDAPWHADDDLTLLISNRRDIVASGTVQNGTQLSWSGPNGKASITFNGEQFWGGAQFPDEGPVGYRGTVAAG